MDVVSQQQVHEHGLSVLVPSEGAGAEPRVQEPSKRVQVPLQLVDARVVEVALRGQHVQTASVVHSQLSGERVGADASLRVRTRVCVQQEEQHQQVQVGVRLGEDGGGRLLGEGGLGGLGLAAWLGGARAGEVGGYLRLQWGVWRVASRDQFPKNSAI